MMYRFKGFRLLALALWTSSCSVSNTGRNSDDVHILAAYRYEILQEAQKGHGQTLGMVQRHLEKPRWLVDAEGLPLSKP